MKMHKSKKRLTAALLACLLAVGSLTGCTSNGGQQSSTASQGGESSTTSQTSSQTEDVSGTEETSNEEPLEMSIMTILFGSEIISMGEDNDVVQKINEEANVRLDIEWVPSTSYTEKVNAAIAGGQLPMVVVADSSLMRSTNIVVGCENDQFWDITDYIQEFPGLVSFYDEQTLKNAYINNRLYGLPRPRNLGRQALMIRKDWLDNLGLDMPTNLEEVYEVAKAFTENDPDQNGQNDTWGLEYMDSAYGNAAENGFNYFVVANGGVNGWGLVDGKLTPDHLTPEYKDTLNYFRDLYSNGYMNQDFSLLSGNTRYDFINGGQAGMFAWTAEDFLNCLDEELCPEAEWEFVPILEDKNGRAVVNSTAGYNGQVMFTKSGIQDEETLRRVLGVFEVMCRDDMQLLSSGIEGRDYKVEDGVFIELPESKAAEQWGQLGYIFPQAALYSACSRAGATGTERGQKMIEYLEVSNENVLSDPTIAFNSDTRTEMGGQLDQIILDARIKYIIGEIDEAQFDAEMDRWLSSGGSSVMEEFQAQYDEYNS